MKQNRLETTVAVRITPQERKVWNSLAAGRGVKMSTILRQGLAVGQAVLALQAGGSQSGQVVNDGNG